MLSAVRRHLPLLLPRHARLYSSKPAPGPGPGLSGSFGSTAQPELGVGELSHAHGSIRIAPLRRTGEDLATMRARLLYQSRKRGILETDLVLSTFADAQLHGMDRAQLEQYDLFLDENDWDIYYWTTQHESETEIETKTEPEPEIKAVPPAGEEWAQTVGTVRVPYRPPPARWCGTEILALLREHVRARAEKGMGRMPDVRVY